LGMAAPFVAFGIAATVTAVVVAVLSGRRARRGGAERG
jgi:hypothetical protein